MIWLLITFLSLAEGPGLFAAEQPIAGIYTIGLEIILSLPFHMFAVATTLINNLVLYPRTPR